MFFFLCRTRLDSIGIIFGVGKWKRVNFSMNGACMLFVSNDTQGINCAVQSSCCCCFWCIISISTKKNKTSNSIKWQSPIHSHLLNIFFSRYIFLERSYTTKSFSRCFREWGNKFNWSFCLCDVIRNGLFQERMRILYHTMTHTHAHTYEYIVFIVQHLII